MAAKSVGFRLFPGAGGEGIRQRACPLRHGSRRATSPKVGGKGCSAAFLALPSGELSAKQTERASLLLPPAGLPSPSSLRDATSPEVGGKGFSAAFLAPTLGKTPPAGGGGTPVPEGERLSAKQTERARFPDSETERAHFSAN